MGQNTYVKFLTNITETVTFKFDSPKEWDNRYKPGEKQYSYGVEWRGMDAYLTATPMLHSKLQSLRPLQGKVLQILKYEDGQAKLWKIMDIHGNELRTDSGPQPYQGQGNGWQGQRIPQDSGDSRRFHAQTGTDGYEDIPTPSTGDFDPIPDETAETIEKMRTWAKAVAIEMKEMTERIVSLESTVTDLARRLVEAEDNVSGLKGVVLDEETMCAFQFHKDVSRGLEKTWEQFHMEWNVKDALGKCKDGVCEIPKEEDDSVAIEPNS